MKLFTVIFVILAVSCMDNMCHGRTNIIFTPDKTAWLKEAIKHDRGVSEAYVTISKKAAAAMDEELPYDKLDYIALKYLVEGDREARSKIVRTIIELSTVNSLEPEDMLHRSPAWRSQLATAKANYNMAVGYSAVSGDLPEVMRDSLARCIYKTGIEPTLHDWLDPMTRHHAINTMGHNYWMACIGNCAIACMAVADYFPQAEEWLEMADVAVEEWLDFEGDIFQNKPRTIDGGAYYESVNYANYGMSQYLLYKYAKGNYNHASYCLTERDSLIADYFMNVCYPTSHAKLPSLYFGDGDEYSNGEMCVKLLYEMGLRNKNMLWYMSKVTPHQHNEGLPADTPLGIIMSPEVGKVQYQPELPLECAYTENGWAIMRDSWADNSTMLGVKCGHTWNHAHADAGSFILYHNGKPVVKDGGNCWYPIPYYREYFFQSEAHNVVMFDGQSQPGSQQYMGSANDGRISDITSGKGIRYVVADASGPTGRCFSRNLRSFLWIDNVIIVIDDVRTHDTGEFSWTLHPGSGSYKKGVDIIIETPGADVMVRPLYPEYLTESDFEHDFPDNLKLKRVSAPKAKQIDEMEAYYTITYPHKCDRLKFLTAYILPDSAGARPEVVRIDSYDCCGMRIMSGDRITDVYLNNKADGHIMHRNSCCRMGAFDSDAYILAYTYPADVKMPVAKKIGRWFMAYGSYVRDPENGSVFDSYVKRTEVW